MAKNKQGESTQDQNIIKDAFHHGMDLVHQAKERAAEEGYDVVVGPDFLDSTDLTHVRLSDSKANTFGLEHRARRAVGNAGLRVIGKEPTLGKELHGEFKPVLSEQKESSVMITHDVKTVLYPQPYRVIAFDHQNKVDHSTEAAQHAKRILGLSMDDFQLNPEQLISKDLADRLTQQVLDGVASLFGNLGADVEHEDAKHSTSFKLNDTDTLVVTYDKNPEQRNPFAHLSSQVSVMISRQEGSTHTLPYSFSSFGIDIEDPQGKVVHTNHVTLSVLDESGNTIDVNDPNELQKAVAIFSYVASHPELASQPEKIGRGYEEILRDAEEDSKVLLEYITDQAHQTELANNWPELASIEESKSNPFLDKELAKMTQPPLIFPEKLNPFLQARRVTHGRD